MLYLCLKLLKARNALCSRGHVGAGLERVAAQRQNVKLRRVLAGDAFVNLTDHNANVLGHRAFKVAFID
jgi:hypothetical protein